MGSAPTIPLKQREKTNKNNESTRMTAPQVGNRENKISSISSGKVSEKKSDKKNQHYAQEEAKVKTDLK
jgi:hypothetical protein